MGLHTKAPERANTDRMSSTRNLPGNGNDVLYCIRKISVSPGHQTCKCPAHVAFGGGFATCGSISNRSVFKTGSARRILNVILIYKARTPYHATFAPCYSPRSIAKR